MISRRSFLFGSCLAGAGLLTASNAPALQAIQNTTNDLSLLKTEVHIDALPQAFEGFKIGMLSDPHVGSCASSSLMSKAVDLLSNEKLDLLVLAGDYILRPDEFLSRFTYSRYGSAEDRAACYRSVASYKESLLEGEHFFEVVAKEAARLNPKHGIVAVLGNHDRWNSALNCSRKFNENGIEMLINRWISIGGSTASKSLKLYGTDDYSTGIPETPESLDSSTIIISHNPDFFAELGKDAVFGLGLSGHTHGGQINLPLIGPIALNIQNPQLIQGLASLNGSPIFVSRGVGTSGLPWRFNCPPEVNVITLRAAPGA